MRTRQVLPWMLLSQRSLMRGRACHDTLHVLPKRAQPSGTIQLVQLSQGQRRVRRSLVARAQGITHRTQQLVT